jgi:Cys-tRNA(Pro)/Cys-tRNA(Cys) deacylase
MPVFVDESVSEYETVFASGGQRGVQIEVRPDDLLGLLDAAPAMLSDE